MAWVLAATLYWFWYVPALPQAVISLSPQRQYVGFTGEGDIVTAQVAREAAGATLLTGPFAVFVPQDGRLRTQFGDSSDLLVAAPENGSHIALRRGDALLVSSLVSERIRLMVPVSSSPVDAAFSSDERFIAVADENRVSYFEIESGERVWQREFRPQDIIGDSVSISAARVVQARLRGSPGQILCVDFSFVEPGKPDSARGVSPETQFLSTATGEQIRGLDDVDGIVEATSGGYAIVRAFPETMVHGEMYGMVDNIYALDELRRLWKVSGENRAALFSPDGQEIWVISQDSDHFFLTRRRTADGALLSAQPELVDGPPAGCVSPDAGWLIAELTHEGRYLPVAAQDLLKKLGIAWDGCLTPRGRHIVRTGADGSHPLMLIPQIDFPDSAFFSPALLRLGHHPFVAVELPDQIRIYSFTPPRNWPWLGWSTLVPAVLFIVFIRRRRRMNPESSK